MDYLQGLRNAVGGRGFIDDNAVKLRQQLQQQAPAPAPAPAPDLRAAPAMPAVAPPPSPVYAPIGSGYANQGRNILVSRDAQLQDQEEQIMRRMQ